jgi:hypothetical protein
MHLDAKISAAVRCLEREYPKGIDPATLDYVVGEITREHHAEFRQRLQSQLRRLLSAVRATFTRVLDDRVNAARAAGTGSH